MTKFATEQVPAQLLREGKAIYDVTLDLIIAESEADELSTVVRSIVRMDFSAWHGSRKRLLRFAVHFRRQENGRYGVCERDSAYAPRVIVKPPIEVYNLVGRSPLRS